MDDDDLGADDRSQLHGPRLVRTSRESTRSPREPDHACFAPRREPTSHQPSHEKHVPISRVDRCQFELRTGGIITPSHMMLDLGLIKEDFSAYHKKYWFDEDYYFLTFARSCAASRALPMVPERFDSEVLPNLHFSKQSDRNVISELYAETFGKVIECATELNWKAIGWDFEIGELMPLLLRAPTLQILDLENNKLHGVSRCVKLVIRRFS